MAKQTIVITRTTTRTKANSSKGGSKSSGSGSHPKCPYCGKFIRKS